MIAILRLTLYNHRIAGVPVKIPTKHTDTPAVTNFYLAEGEKNGIGTQQSHERYEILMNRLQDSETLEMNDVRDSLDSVSKDNFGEFESTEWSIVMNQTTGEVRYYHRENYNIAYTFTVTGGQESYLKVFVFFHRFA